mgnify:CR=1 FL=1
MGYGAEIEGELIWHIIRQYIYSSFFQRTSCLSTDAEKGTVGNFGTFRLYIFLEHQWKIGSLSNRNNISYPLYRRMDIFSKT